MWENLSLLAKRIYTFLNKDGKMNIQSRTLNLLLFNYHRFYYILKGAK